MYPNWKEPLPVSSNSKNAWTSSSRYSSSQADIETMRQRPVNGDFGFDFFFAIVSPSASMPVPEPVAVVLDQLAVPHGVFKFRLRDGKRRLTIPSFAEQPFLFLQLGLLGSSAKINCPFNYTLGG
jgi:hypothetical protein